MRAHAESINLTLASPLDEDDAREILSKAQGRAMSQCDEFVRGHWYTRSKQGG